MVGIDIIVIKFGLDTDIYCEQIHFRSIT